MDQQERAQRGRKRWHRRRQASLPVLPSLSPIRLGESKRLGGLLVALVLLDALADLVHDLRDLCARLRRPLLHGPVEGTHLHEVCHVARAWTRSARTRHAGMRA